jgi:hypothetical protein
MKLFKIVIRDKYRVDVRYEMASSLFEATVLAVKLNKPIIQIIEV